MSNFAFSPLVVITTILNVPGTRFAGSLATICVSLADTTVSWLALNATVGLPFDGSNPEPLSISWFVP
jgi:hypothetical protein